MCVKIIVFTMSQCDVCRYWKWKGEPTPDTVLSYQYATGRAAYPHKQIMNSIKYPCGPVAFADEQQYPWRPGFDPKAEENRRKMLLKREKELYLELNPPPPTDKKSLRYLRDKLRSAAFFINGVNLDTLFRHYDLDNNGILDVEEFTFALRKDCGLAEVRCMSSYLGSATLCETAVETLMNICY